LVEESKKKRTPANETEEAIGAAKSGLDSINEALRLNGYTGFSIQPSGKKHGEFQIQREDGSYVRNTLSEGEATIITFLYFIQMVEGNIGGESSAGKKVVVIDDPICSLDYTSIALVSTLTNDLIEKARKGENGIEQVFVLTHNTSFHKQISVEQPKNKTSYWKLYKKDGVSRVAAFGGDNPVRNDYQAMWDKLLDEGSDETDVEKKNLMRRIIETYFLQYGGMDWEQLYDGEQIVDLDMEKFRGIFEKIGHLSHYEMMRRGK
jgi:wobble nucleotide-excising tRNase